MTDSSAATGAGRESAESEAVTDVAPMLRCIAMMCISCVAGRIRRLVSGFLGRE